MAADDLLYSVKDGEAVPTHEHVRKFFPFSNNIIIGTAAILIHPGIKYEFQQWISAFVESQNAASAFNRPENTAIALKEKMRDTFNCIESMPEDSVWKCHLPGDRLVSYFIAGYAESFHRPYIFEIGTEINQEGNGLFYLPIKQHRSNDIVWTGEDHFWLRAKDGLDPESSLWESMRATTDVAASLPDLPPALSEMIASMVGLIKVESHFNPKKVGGRVAVGVILRATRKILYAGF